MSVRFIGIEGIMGSFLSSCLGIGSAMREEKALRPLPYADGFDIALESANQFVDECKKINFANFPAIVSIGTSKSRGVITLHYRYDLAYGSICSMPPVKGTVKEAAEILIVPRFGAEFYMHI